MYMERKTLSWSQWLDAKRWTRRFLSVWFTTCSQTEKETIRDEMRLSKIMDHKAAVVQSGKTPVVQQLRSVAAVASFIISLKSNDSSVITTDRHATTASRHCWKPQQ